MTRSARPASSSADITQCWREVRHSRPAPATTASRAALAGLLGICIAVVLWAGDLCGRPPGLFRPGPLLPWAHRAAHETGQYRSPVTPSAPVSVPENHHPLPLARKRAAAAA